MTPPPPETRASGPQNPRTPDPQHRRKEDLDAYFDGEDVDAGGLHSGTARRLFRVMLRHPGLLAAGSVVVLAGTAAALIEPRLIGYAIDDAIVPRNWPRLVELTALFFLLVLGGTIGMIGEAYLFEMLGQAVMQDLRLAVFSRLQRLPLAAHDRNPAGRLMTRVTNDVVALGEIFSAGFVTMVSNALLVAGILVWLLVLNPRLGLITVSVFPFMMFATARFSGQLKVSYRDARSKLSALNAFLAENLMGMKTVHLFNREPIHMERFARLNQRYTDAQVRTIRTYAYLQPTITLAGGISMALVIWFGGRATAAGTIPVGVLVTYFAYAVALFRPMREIADKWNVFLSGMASAERIFEVLDWTTEFDNADADTSVAPYADVRGAIVFDHVWFAYDAEHWVLKDVSVEITAGARLGVVGHTGSGKTTLIALLMRFYEPQKGRILLDGRDLREYDKRRLRATLGLVQQDVFLFSGSVADNVSLFSGEALVTPLTEDFGLPLDRDLSERAGNVSAGERQLIAFARAQAAAPGVWILDEATSNMDSASEARLQDALMSASTGKTVIVIAHRLATTRTCDRVIVLNKGHVAESGDHASLMREDGLYARLFRYQQVVEDKDPEGPTVLRVRGSEGGPSS